MPSSAVLNLYRQAVSECENSYVVWSALDNAVEQIAMVLDCIEIEDEGRLKDRFQLFVCNILAPILNSFSRMAGRKQIRMASSSDGYFCLFIL